MGNQETYTHDEALSGLYVFMGCEDARKKASADEAESLWGSGSHMDMAEVCLSAATVCEQVWNEFPHKDRYTGVYLYEVAELLGAWLFTVGEFAPTDAIKAKALELIEADTDKE